MKLSRLFVAAFAASLFSVPAMAEDVYEIGDVRVINAQEEVPQKLPKIEAGDIVQVVLGNPSAGPEYHYAKIKVVVEGESVSTEGVANLPRRRNAPIGVTRLAVLLSAKSAGESTVTITPLNAAGKELESKILKLNVQENSKDNF